MSEGQQMRVAEFSFDNVYSELSLIGIITKLETTNLGTGLEE